MSSFEESLARHQSALKVGVSGDWHGDAVWAERVLAWLNEQGINLLLHAGDFNIWPGPPGKRYLRRIDEMCQKYDVDIWITPGNHEDWDRLDKLWENPRNTKDGVRQPLSVYTERISVLPRPFRFDLGSTRFASVGGAGSVNFYTLREGVNWWPTEMLTEAEAAEAKAFGPVDVMITHETPDTPWATQAVTSTILSNPIGFAPEGLALSAQSRAILTPVVESLRPRALFHGHMHVSGSRSVQFPDADYRSDIVSLANEWTQGNTRILTLSDNLEIE